jgi:hypothetical protein
MSVSFKPRHIPSDVWEARDELSSRHRADSRDARPLAFYPVATIARDMTNVRGVFANGTAPYAAYQWAARSFFASMLRTTPPMTACSSKKLAAQAFPYNRTCVARRTRPCRTISGVPAYVSAPARGSRTQEPSCCRHGQSRGRLSRRRRLRRLPQTGRAADPVSERF